MEPPVAGTVEQLTAIVEVRVAVMQLAELLHVRTRCSRYALSESAIEGLRSCISRRASECGQAQEHDSQRSEQNVAPHLIPPLKVVVSRSLAPRSVKRQLAGGTAIPSFVASCLAEHSRRYDAFVNPTAGLGIATRSR